VRFAFVLAEKANHRITTLCRVLEVSRQGFYAWQRRRPCRRKKRDESLSVRIKQAFQDSDRTYGAPRVHRELGAQGVRTSRKRVARLMRQHSLVARPRPRRFFVTTDSRHRYPVPANVLARNFAPAGPNLAWATDITYIDTRQGWLFLAVVLDLYSRKVVGWAMERYLDRRLVVAALNMAIVTRSPAAGLIHHSDRGVQYACDDYQQILAEHGMVPSMSRTGNCWDNAVPESFFSTLKHELVYRRNFATHDEARSALFQYIEGFYNPRRLHSSLGFLSPAEYEHKARPN
jgi:transposase InsO family protein